MKKCIRCQEVVNDGILFCPYCSGESFYDVEHDEVQDPFTDAFVNDYD